MEPFESMDAWRKPAASPVVAAGPAARVGASSRDITGDSAGSEPIVEVLAPFREFTRRIGWRAARGGCPGRDGARQLRLVGRVVGTVGDRVAITLGPLDFSQTLLHWIDDGLMAIFFLVVGLEMKQAAGRRAGVTSPGDAPGRHRAAAGGAIVPAVIFLGLAGGGEASRGWGVPMATDIAFALGVLAILGSRVPLGLRLPHRSRHRGRPARGAVRGRCTSDLSLPALAAAGAMLALVAANVLGVRRPLASRPGHRLLACRVPVGRSWHRGRGPPGIPIPSRTRLDPAAFVDRARGIIDDFEGGQAPATMSEARSTRPRSGTRGRDGAGWAPMVNIEHTLHPWTSFLIVPLFALANAGVTIAARLAAIVVEPCSWASCSGW